MTCVPLGWARQAAKGASWCPALVPPQCPGRAALGWWPEGWSWHPPVPLLLRSRLLCIAHLLHPLLRPCCRLSLRALLKSCCSPCRRDAQSCLGVSRAMGLRWLALQSLLAQREPLQVEVCFHMSRKCSSCSPPGLLAPPGTAGATDSFIPLQCVFVGEPTCQQPSECL